MAQSQHAELGIYDVVNGTTRVLLSATLVLEAPNWTPDGERLLFNAGGELWFIEVANPATPEKLETGALDNFNNDHLISPDG
ncbi:biopolymer transporter Tol, partial [Mesorhizobium sp. ZMM04-4]